MATYTKVPWNINVAPSGAAYAGGIETGVGSMKFVHSYNVIFHTAPSGTTSLDELWLWVWKTDYNYNFSLGFGDGATGTSFSSNMTQVRFPSSSTNWLVLAGHIMQNSDTCGGSSANYGSNWCRGYVNRITY